MTGHDEESIKSIVEQLGCVLATGGIDRMPSRVLAALVLAETPQLMVTEITEILHISPAAVSAAVRQLALNNLVTRERLPGTRRDCYRLRDGAWYETAAYQHEHWSRWEEALRSGLAAVSEGTPAAARLRESLAFLEFVRAEFHDVRTKWRQMRDVHNR